MFGRSLIKITTLALTAILSLGGCGGGGSAGIDRSGSRTISGPIDGFDGVTINGIRYQTDNAEVYVRGQKSSEQALKVGDYVTVIGSVNEDEKNGVADQIYYQPNVTGPISYIDLENDQFVILGQTIKITEDTSFDPRFKTRDILGLSEGDQVTVSGPNEGQGVIIASRIQKVSSSSLEISGVISDVYQKRRIFRLNDQWVKFSEATILAGIVPGRQVVVTGERIENNALVATLIRDRKEDSFILEGRYLELRGYIWNINYDKEFSVLNFRFKLDPETEFINGDIDSLAAKKPVKIAGIFSKNGILTAKKIIFLNPSNSKISGRIKDIKAIPLKFEKDKPKTEFKVNNTVVVATPYTRIEAYGENFKSGRINLDEISIGDTMVAAGRYIDNKLMANAILIRRNVNTNDDKQELQGDLENISDQELSFKVYGITIKIKPSTKIYSGSTRLEPDLFMKLLPYVVVSVVGIRENDNTIIAEYIRIRRFKQ